MRIRNAFMIMALAGAIIATGGTANADPTMTIGVGSAVTSPNRTAIFDEVHQGDNLSDYTEDELVIATQGLAEIGFVCDLWYEGNGCSYTVHQPDGFSAVKSFTKIAAEPEFDWKSKISAIELDVASNVNSKSINLAYLIINYRRETGYPTEGALPPPCNPEAASLPDPICEIFQGTFSIPTDSSDLSTRIETIGFSDMPFNELYIAAYAAIEDAQAALDTFFEFPYGTGQFPNGIAIDNVLVKMVPKRRAVAVGRRIAVNAEPVIVKGVNDAESICIYRRDERLPLRR